MGSENSNTNSSPEWLILDTDENIQVATERVNSSLIWYPSTYNKGKDNDKYEETITDKDWSEYRWKMQRKTRNSQTAMKPSKKYFIIAEYHKDTKNNLISEELRQSLLNNLSKLSKDKSVESDIRNVNGSKYLYPKTNTFGRTSNKDQSKDNENQISQTTSKQNNVGSFYESYFYDSDDDYQDPVDKLKTNLVNTNNNNKDNNTVRIHDLIDPNKNAMDHKLWIPTVFNCKQNEHGIISEIPNLDRIKHKSLYNDIENIFFRGMKSSFENVLGRNLYDKEKIIIKSMKYLLNKPGDKYLGNVHREGMGENIIAAGIYYPSASKEIIGGDLELTVVASDSFYGYGDNTKKYTLKIFEGSMIVFSNECYHRLVSIEYPKSNNKNSDNKQLERTILAYFLISPNGINVAASDDKRLEQRVNLQYNSKYILNYWWKECNLENVDKIWMIDLVTILLCGDFDYIYDQRDKMRFEKGKGVKGPPKRRRPNYGCLEGGTPY